jgi:tetratricopeptide (TPR) repeat protein
MSELAVALALHLLLAAADPAEGAARAAASDARAAFELGDFERSLVKYGEAWALKPAPRLLFNLGQCHRRLGHHDEAMRFFQRYLDSGTAEPAQASATQQLILDEREALAREETARQLELTRRKLELEALLKQPPPAALPITRQWWFWTGLGVVAAAAVTTGLAVGLAPRPARTTFPDINAR